MNQDCTPQTSHSYFEIAIWIVTVITISCFYIFEATEYSSVSILICMFVMLLMIIIENRGKLRVKLWGLHFSIILFAIFSFISSIWAVKPTDAIEKAITVVEMLGFVSILDLHYSNTEDSVNDLLSAIMWAGYVVTIYVFITIGFSVVLRYARNGMRIADLLFNSTNAIGSICALSIIISIYFIIYKGFKVFYLLSILSFVLLIACGTRRGFVLLIIGVFLIYFLRAISKKNTRSAISFLIIVAGAIFVVTRISSFALLTGITSRLQQLSGIFVGAGSVDSGTALREKYIKLGLELFKKSPLVGIGIGNAHLYTRSMFTYDAYLHNNYIEMLADGGIIGFIIYYSMYKPAFRVIKPAISDKNGLAQIILTLLVFNLLSDMAVVSYYSKITYLMIYVFALYNRKHCLYEG